MGKTLVPKWDPKVSTAAGEAAFDRNVEKSFRSHQELPSGRNFTCWNRDAHSVDNKAYKKNFDDIFPNSPGAGF